MRYVVIKRFKAAADCGAVNLPYGTVCEERDGWIWHGKRRLCAATSENAHRHFTRDDDGEGLIRGALTRGIMERLRTTDAGPEKRDELWERVWRDPVCRQFKRAERADYWLWNHEFFNAPINELRHIAQLVGEKKGA